MPAALLATKFHCPALTPDCVARPHLTLLLDAGLQRRLILLSAPAGFGKTSLLAEWLAARTPEAGRGTQPDSDASAPAASFAWLALDRDDAAPARFWTYVIAALQTVAPQVGLAAQAALQAAPAALETALTALINDLDSLAHPLILVLDDYHLITTPAIHQALDYLLEHLPEPLRLAALSLLHAEDRHAFITAFSASHRFVTD